MPDKSGDVRAAVGRLAGVLRHGLSPGDVAALRRLDAADVGIPALWRALLSADIELPAGGPARDRAERRWGVLLRCLATLGELHRFGVPLGRALADAGLSELRLVRLLRATGDALEDEVRSATRYLAAKIVQADATEFMWLLLTDENDATESVRRLIARSYYAVAYQAAKGD